MFWESGRQDTCSTKTFQVNMMSACSIFTATVFIATILNPFLGTDDKIDSNFSDLTSRFDGIVDHEENCILEALCERHQGTFSKKYFFLLDR